MIEQKVKDREGMHTMVPSLMAAARFWIGDAMVELAVAKRVTMVVRIYMLVFK